MCPSHSPIEGMTKLRGVREVTSLPSNKSHVTSLPELWFMCKLIKMLLSAFLCVLIPILSAFAVVKTFTFFERANVELGFQHYAEKADPNTFLKMPANACINLGYGLVGLYWLWKVNRRKKKLRDKAFFYYVFAWMSMFYGLVQFGRIVTQTRLFAILDQWLTLPFFAWIVCWTICSVYVPRILANFSLPLYFACFCAKLFCCFMS